MEWSDEGVGGAERFLNRLVALFGPDRDAIVARLADAGGPAALDAALARAELDELGHSLRRRLHLTIKKVTQDTERFAFNTAIAALMELLNETARYRAQAGEATELYCALAWSFARLLAPFTPHLAEELHQWFGGQGTIYDSGWPSFDESLLGQATIEVVLQLNGKVRDRMVVASESDAAALRERALESPKLRELIGDRPVKQVVVVPGRLVNVVI